VFVNEVVAWISTTGSCCQFLVVVDQRAGCSFITLLYKACRFFSNLISSPSGVAGFFIR
jgi:hypothetical protein